MSDTPELSTLRTPTVIKNIKHVIRSIANKNDHVLTNFSEQWLSPDGSARYWTAYCIGCCVTVVVRDNGDDEGRAEIARHCTPPIKPRARPLGRLDLDNGVIYGGMILYDMHSRNADGTPKRYRVGSVTRWKREPGRFEISLHHGVLARGWSYCTNLDQLHTLSVDDPDSYAYPF